MSRLLTLWLAVLALLTGCASIPETPPAREDAALLWQQRQQQLEPFTEWSIRGRVALYVDEDVYNLGLSWQRNGDISSMKFEASLGQGLIRLEKQAQQVELTTAEGDFYRGDNAQQILLETTGLNIPVEGLETWIKGIPHRHSAHRPELDAMGRAKSLLQDGWRINYLEYAHEQALASPLPRKLYMKHDGLALKIVIDQWQNSTQSADPGLFPAFPN